MSTSAQSASTGSRPTLTDLPKELLRLILIHADRPSAVALARVSRALTQSAEIRIWRDVDLSLNPHHGEHPLIRPHVRTANRPGQEWSIENAKAAEERHREAIREKVKEVVKHADHRRCGLVEKLRMVPRPGAVVGMLMFLDMVSPNLTTLEIDSPTPHSLDEHWRPRDGELLDFRLVDARLTLPVLTHLHLGPKSFRYRQFVPFLASRAPSLKSLSVHIDQTDPLPAEDTPPETDPLAIRDLHVKSSTSIWAMMLLRHTPHVVRLSLDCPAPASDLEPRFVIALGTLASLQELEWQQILPSLLSAGRPANFPCLRRVLLKSSDWDATFINIPPIPTLKSIHVSPWLDEKYQVQELSAATTSKRVKSLQEAVAAELGIASNLRILNTLREPITSGLDVFSKLAEIEYSGTATAFIDSVRHHGRELFHGRFITPYVTTKVHPISERVLSLPPGMISRTYDSGVSQQEVLQYRLSPAVWEHRTYFEGEPVPLALIERLRVLEGKTEAEWTGRGISVGEKAWKVLTGWHERALRLRKAKAAEVVEAQA